MIALRPIIDLRKLFVVRWPDIEWNIAGLVQRSRTDNLDDGHVRPVARITSPRLDAPTLSVPGGGSSVIGQVPLLMGNGRR